MCFALFSSLLYFDLLLFFRSLFWGHKFLLHFLYGDFCPIYLLYLTTSICLLVSMTHDHLALIWWLRTLINYLHNVLLRFHFPLSFLHLYTNPLNPLTSLHLYSNPFVPIGVIYLHLYSNPFVPLLSCSRIYTHWRHNPASIAYSNPLIPIDSCIYTQTHCLPVSSNILFFFIFLNLHHISKCLYPFFTRTMQYFQCIPLVKYCILYMSH